MQFITYGIHRSKYLRCESDCLEESVKHLSASSELDRFSKTAAELVAEKAVAGSMRQRAQTELSRNRKLLSNINGVKS